MIIGLLGPSGAGKSAYLTRLYGVLQTLNKSPSYGIKFAVEDSDLQTQLERHHSQLVQKGEFATATTETTEYPLSLKGKDAQGNDHKLDVTIVDFPGEWVHGSDPKAREKREKTIQGLAACDGFIVLLDGQVLIDSVQRKTNPEQLQDTLKAHAVSDVLGKALELRRKNSQAMSMNPDDPVFGTGPVPISFIVTKGDKIARHLGGKGVDKIDDTDIRMTISQLFQINAAVGGAPVKGERTLGNFVRSQYGKIIDAPDVASVRMPVAVYDEVGKRICDENVAAPFQFVLLGGLLNAKAEYAARHGHWSDANQKDAFKRDGFERDVENYKTIIEKNRQDLDDYIARRGFIDDIIGAFDGDSIENRKRETWRENIQKRDQAFNEYTKFNEKVGESYKVCKTIDGHTATVNFFLPRVLSDQVVYGVDRGQNLEEQFFVKNFQIPTLKYQSWWSAKSGQHWLALLNKQKGTGSTIDLDWD